MLFLLTLNKNRHQLFAVTENLNLFFCYAIWSWMEWLQFLLFIFCTLHLLYRHFSIFICFNFIFVFKHPKGNAQFFQNTSFGFWLSWRFSKILKKKNKWLPFSNWIFFKSLELQSSFEVSEMFLWLLFFNLFREM